ncbi:MAG: tetratricopeptide repeat protein [Myxococcales bacterium]
MNALLAAGLLLAQLPPPPGVAGALALEREGKPREALAALAAAHAEPGSALAGRILYERARLTDEHLRDPLAAAKLYGDYVAAFPTGAYAKLAADRQAYLLRNGGPAPEALADYEDVLRDFARSPGGDLVARMGQVIDRFPTFPLRDHACFWLANVLRQKGDYAGAAHWLGVIVRDDPGSDDARRAELGLAQDLVAQNDFAAGIAAVQRYVDSDDPLARELARSQLAIARERRLWYWLFRGGLAVISGFGLALAAGIFRRRAPLRPFPFEVRLFAPVAALLILLTFAANRKVGVAVAIIAGGGVVLTALQGAYLRAASPRGLRRWLTVLVGAAAAASLGFCAINACGLTDLVVETLTQGADR